MLQLANHDIHHYVVILSEAAQIFRKHVFSIKNTFSGTLSEESQLTSVPTMLLSFMQMLLEGPGITGNPSLDKPVDKSSAALSISQLVVFNTVKKRKKGNSIPRHIRDRETPITIYIAIKIYAVTRKKSIINILHERGLCISYDRLRTITVDIANSIIAHFESQGVVAPVQAKQGIFTTFALDNIDHNPSSTTCRSSFHGTSISMVQFPGSIEEEQDETVIMNPAMMGKNNVSHLPVSYTTLQHIYLQNDNIYVPALRTTNPVELRTPTSKLKETIPTANDWLDHSHQLLSKHALEEEGWISWAAYNAVKFGQVAGITPSMMFPLFRGPAHSPMMIYHGMNVIIAVSNHLNPGQTPIMTVDQPFFTIAKKIQWKFPDTHGENQFVVILGAMHTEKMVLDMLGDWLEGSGWTTALTNSGITSSGVAESFIGVSHLTRTRYFHQVTALALYTLFLRAHDQYFISTSENDQLSLIDWTYMQTSSSSLTFCIGTKH